MDTKRTSAEVFGDDAGLGKQVKVNPAEQPPMTMMDLPDDVFMHFFNKGFYETYNLGQTCKRFRELWHQVIAHEISADRTLGSGTDTKVTRCDACRCYCLKADSLLVNGEWHGPEHLRECSGCRIKYSVYGKAIDRCDKCEIYYCKDCQNTYIDMHECADCKRMLCGDCETCYAGNHGRFACESCLRERVKEDYYNYTD